MPDDDTHETDLTFHTKLELDAGVVSYIDPDVHIEHDCKMEVSTGEDDRSNLITFRCRHGHFSFPFSSVGFKESS